MVLDLDQKVKGLVQMVYFQVQMVMVPDQMVKDLAHALVQLQLVFPVLFKTLTNL